MRTVRQKISTLCLAGLLLSLLVVSPFSVLPNESRSETSIASPGDLKTKLLPGKSVVPPPAPHVDMPHLLAATYYNLNNGLTGTLMLSNQGPHNIEIGVTLFNLSGARLAAPTITLEGNTVRGFNLNGWAAAGGSDFSEGNLQVVYTGKDMELGGVVTLVDAARSLIFDEELSEPMMFASSRLEGVWWLRSHNSEMRLALSNTSDASLSVNVNVDGLTPNQNGPKTLSLGPHESRTMPVQDFAENGRGTLLKIGGISINHSGSPGALLARGLIEEPETGYSSVVEFSDPQTAKSSRLDGAGLRIGQIGGELLTQVAVARNVGDTPSLVTGLIAYTTSNGNTGELSLPTVRLAPGEVKEIKLAEAIEASGISSVMAAGLHFEYSGQPRSVVISAQSVSSSGNQVFRVPMVDAKAQQSSTGKYPWSIDGSSSTFVDIKNATDHPQKYILQLNYASGVYALGIKTIEAGQTVALDVRALRDNQIPDESGHTIPLDATGGQLYWSVDGPENLTLIGRAEQVDVARGLSSTSACGTCCPATFFNGFCDPSSVTGSPGDTTQFTAMQRKMDCNGNVLAPVIVGASWSSTNTVVATVAAGGLATAQNPGTANIQATWNVIYYSQGTGCECSDVCSLQTTCCVRTFDTFTASALCNVQEVTFISASDGFSSTGFIANHATLPVSCGGERFVLRVRFRGPSDTTGYCNTGGPLPCFVTLSNDNKFQFADSPVNPGINYEFHSDGGPGPYVDIGLRRRGDGGGTTGTVNISVSGTRSLGSGTFSGSGFVSLSCR